jgi:uncharacterized membrane protein YfcA
MYKSKIRKSTLAVSTAGALFASRVISIPEAWRTHLPYAIDVASGASNLIPGVAIGMLAIDVLKPRTKAEKIAIATGALAFSTLINFAVEDKAVNQMIVPPEAHIIMGEGERGEPRDIAHGIGGTALGIGFVSYGRRSKEQTSPHISC